MTRKVELLTPENLALLPGNCSTCVFWELDPVRRREARGHESEAKAEWLSMMLREWGPVGRVIRIDGSVVGHLMWAPARFLPGGDCFAGSPVSTDAVLLAGSYIEPSYRGRGLGRVLIQSMAKDLINQGHVSAIETFGAQRPQRPRDEVCVLPLEFLNAVGFRAQRPHPRYPRVRMDLRTAVTWREELGTAAERLLGAVKRPARTAATPTTSALGVTTQR